ALQHSCSGVAFSDSSRRGTAARDGGRAPPAAKGAPFPRCPPGHRPRRGLRGLAPRCSAHKVPPLGLIAPSGLSACRPTAPPVMEAACLTQLASWLASTDSSAHSLPKITRRPSLWRQAYDH